MRRPIPTSDGGKFDIVSLSLVLNYVPDPAGRGEMLRRTTWFLRARNDLNGTKDDFIAPLPSLFLTLPLPCVTNSRYMTAEHLERIMNALGFSLARSKRSAKIFYSLWHLQTPKNASKDFKKVEIQPGPKRNNFCVVLRSGT